MNDILQQKINDTSIMIEKVKNTLNLSLDFDSIGIVQASVYQNNLSELEKEVESLRDNNFFKDILLNNGKETKAFSNDAHDLSRNYCLLTVKLLNQIKKEKEDVIAFINDKNKQISNEQKEIDENNKKINKLEENIKQKQIEIDNAEKELSNNLSNQKIVEEKNELLKGLYKKISLYQNSLFKLQEANKKVEVKKRRLINGTHSTSTKFIKRKEVEFKDIELQKESELNKVINESKKKYEEIISLVNTNVDINKLGVAGIAAYREKLIALQKEINETFITDSYNKAASLSDELSFEEMSGGIYKLSIINSMLTNDSMDKLKSKEEECTLLFNNGMKEYTTLRNRVEQNKKQIESYKKANSDIRFRIVDLQGDSSKLDEIDELKGIINKNEILMGKLTNENESITKEIIQLLNGGKVINKEKNSDINREITVSDNVETENVENNAVSNIETESVSDTEDKAEINVENKSAENDEIKTNDFVEKKYVVKKNSPKLSWKTAISVAAGIGIGAAVFFTAGPLGVGIMDAAGTLAKIAINNRQKKLATMSPEERIKINRTKPPRNGFERTIANFKKYLKSDEGLRDMQWLVSSAIITGSVLSVGSMVQSKIASSKLKPTTVNNTNVASFEPAKANVVSSNTVASSPNSVVETLQISPTPSPYDNIVIGNNVGNYNVSIGHASASRAVNGVDGRALISKYVNSDSVFSRFAVINNDGSLGQIINTNGLSLTDFCSQNGIDISRIAVDVARKDGASQAWVSINELTQNVGGMTL